LASLGTDSRAGAGPSRDPVPLSDEQHGRLLDLLRAARALDGRQHHGAPADGPLSSGLPATLSPTLPEDGGFVQFPNIAEADDIPLGRDWSFEPANSTGAFNPPLSMAQMVAEEGWARLPAGGVIRQSRDRAGQTVWDYPAGTRLLHRIFFNSDARRKLFEVRYIEKRPDGKWAMGLYHPAGAPLPLGDTGNLSLLTARDAETTFELQTASGAVRVNVKRLQPDSCRHCHFNMGEGGYQYPDEEHTGPCGFVPANAGLTTTWAERYRGRYGVAPFGPAPAGR
jgi:hypothetical protein